MLFCIEEYKAIRNKTSKKFKTVKAFCEYHNFSRQNFLKIYHRWKQNPDMSSLVPQKRGPRFAKIVLPEPIPPVIPIKSFSLFFIFLKIYDNVIKLF